MWDLGFGFGAYARAELGAMVHLDVWTCQPFRVWTSVMALGVRMAVIVRYLVGGFS